eukprot:SM000078S22019  [mRNA]  locus=s78:5748:9431:+ [translate_table: standard]
MKNLAIPELKQLADELRSEVIFTVSKTGGHLGSSLGVVELTVALHHVFNSPADRMIWDVGHQTYPHKILTGRRSKMLTLRSTGGLAGFTKRSESEHDCFGAGHSSTSISAGLGMAVGRDLKGGKNHVISVIGDGAMTAGQAYEAMNNAGYLDTNMIVILNDNKQVSLPTATLDGPAPPVGALSSALSKLQSSRPLRELREVAKFATKQIGGPVHELASKVDEYARVVKFDPATGKQFKTKVKTQAYTTYFAEALVAEAEQDKSIVAIHAAMGGGTGLNLHPAATSGTQTPSVSSLKLGRVVQDARVQHACKIGKGRILTEGTDVALLGYGTMVQNCLAAQVLLAQHGVSATVADARFCKPLDGDLLRQLARHHRLIVTVEEGSVGGFGSHAQHFMTLDGLLDSGKLLFRSMTLPDRYIDHGAPADQLSEAGLTASHIAATSLKVLGRKSEALQLLS